MKYILSDLLNMRKGRIVSVTVDNCDKKSIRYLHLPTKENDYHSELHKDTQKKH